jgi:hypothetical protein
LPIFAVPFSQLATTILAAILGNLEMSSFTKPMKLTQIIAAIQKSSMENAEAVAQGLTDYVAQLGNEQESRIKDLTTQIDTLTTAMGIDQGSTEEKLNAANTAIAALNTERETLKAENVTLQGTIALNSREALIRSVAEIEKVNATVLEAVLGTEEVTIEAGKVTVKNQSLKEWVKQNKAAFIPALYAAGANKNLPKTPPHQQTPAGDSEEEEEEKTSSAIDNYFDQNYKVPKFLSAN